MRSRDSRGINRPFERLAELFEHRAMRPSSLPPSPAKPHPCRDRPILSPGEESQLFREAMADVKPINDNRHWRLPQYRPHDRQPASSEDHDALGALELLLYSGQGFVVSQTSEYMEAAGPGVSPETIRRLHQGHYAIQDHIDLHGCTAQAAEAALLAFFQEAFNHNYRAVLIVHGRGLASPGEPVLKAKVYQWLTRGPLRKHVIALTSARSCDGGAGATYVLLRRRPLTKRSRKR